MPPADSIVEELNFNRNS